MTYLSFYRSEPSTFEVEPWCVKFFEQRWYLLGKSERYEEPRIYGLDRISVLAETGRTFKLPKKFDAEKFFAGAYGIHIGDEEFEVGPVALKVDAKQRNYLRTLPLHHTQIEVESTAEYSVFEYRLCPTFDFRQKLLSMGGSVRVLAPTDLALTMCDEAQWVVDSYVMSADGQPYKFKIYKK